MKRILYLFLTLAVLLGVNIPLSAQIGGGGGGGGTGNGNGIAIGGLPVGSSGSLSDPNADRILFWDDSAGIFTFLTVGGGLSISGTTLSASGGAGSGDVVGPAGATDNALVRYDSTTGTLIQNSGAILDDTNNLSGVLTLTLATTGALRTAASAGNTMLIQARDVDGAAYTTFITCTANNTPTCDASAAFTVASSAIATAAKDLSFFSSTTSAQLATLISNETGSSLLVFNTSPTLVTPVLGVATATSINGLTLTTSTGTLTITNGKVVSFSNQLTFTGTDASSVAFGTGGTVAYTANTLAVFASTTSAQLATLLSDETGSGGGAVFATGPTLAVPLFSGWRESYAAKTATYTVLSSDTILTCDSTGGAVTFDLPTAGLVSGRNYTFKKIDTSSNACTIDPSSTQTVDGASTYTMTVQWDAVTIYSNGANWEIKSNGNLGLADPGADRIVFWDDSANHLDWLTVAGCSISGTTLTCAGSGDVTAAAAFAVDNVLIRSDGTAKGVQASGIVVDDSDNLSAITSITMKTAGALRTTTTTANTLLIQAYDVDGAAYTTFLTCTSGNTPTCDFSASVTVASSALASAASTTSFTNKTIDAEATGNLITLPMLVVFNAGACQNSTAGLSFDLPTTLGATATCQGAAAGGNAVLGTALFVNTEIDEVQGHFPLPADWTGAIDVTLDWNAVSTTGNDVVWTIKFGCAAVNEAPSTVSYNATNFTAVTNLTTTLRLNKSTKTGITTTGCSASEHAFFIILRSTATTGDTLDADVQLISATFTIRRAI